MTIERINPPQLYDSLRFGFSHATLQKAGATLHLAGQVAWDAQTNVVGAGDEQYESTDRTRRASNSKRDRYGFRQTLGA